MKRRFSKILGVGLTLALLFSLLLTAAPVSALTTPTVTVDDPTISQTTDYSIVFDLGVRLGGTSTLTFPVSSDDIVTVTAGAAGATLTWPALTTVVVTGGDGSPISGESFTTPLVFTGQGVGQTAEEDVVLTLTAGSIATIADSGAGTNTVVISEAALPTDSIIIEFDEDTDITGVHGKDVTVAATYGIGTEPWGPEPITINEATDIDGQELTIDVPLAIGVGAMVQVVVPDVKNPDDPGDYTLDVSTSNEDAKTATYEIGVPDIAGLPGVVSLYNSSGILMDQKTEPNAIWELLEDAGKDFTIKVGPGTYVITKPIVITLSGLTLKSTDGAATTIIDGSSLTEGMPILKLIDSPADVTVEGFTFDKSPGDGMWISGEGAIVQNNIITEAAWFGITLTDGGTAKATVSGNIITDCPGGIDVIGDGSQDNTVSDNVITGCAASNPRDSDQPHAAIRLSGGLTGPTNSTDGNTITGNTLTDNDGCAIVLCDGTFYKGGVYFDDNLIEGNTISGNELEGITIETGLTITGLQILDNVITDNEGVGIGIESFGATNTIKFNTITGNDADKDGYGIANDGGAAVDATFNWWGTTVAADIATMINDVGTSDVTDYEPFLADTADAVFSASDVAVGADSLVAKDTVGVAVSVTTVTTDATDVISVAKYIANPEEAIADWIGFYDVYVAGDLDLPADEVTIKFYAGDAQTDVYIWAAGTQTWEKVDADFSAYGGYVYVTIEDPANLTGTPFALVAGTAAAIEAPELSTPLSGADDVRLRPVFAWKAVPDADGYYFQLADNASFVVPLVKMEGDTGRLSGTAYAYVGEELPYSTPYHWRVKAVSGTIAAGDLARSDWTEGVFVTMDEPVEPTPPVVIEPTPTPPAPIIEPIVEVIVPPVTEITPGWIYAIIAVGGVLVIALLVLIVRTRRVA